MAAETGRPEAASQQDQTLTDRLESVVLELEAMASEARSKQLPPALTVVPDEPT